MPSQKKGSSANGSKSGGKSGSAAKKSGGSISGTNPKNATAEKTKQASAHKSKPSKPVAKTPSASKKKPVMKPKPKSNGKGAGNKKGGSAKKANKEKEDESEAEDEEKDEQSEDAGMESDPEQSSDESQSNSSEDEPPVKKRRRQPQCIVTRPETTMDWKYSGGTNLEMFRSEFMEMATLNGWSRSLAVHRLKSHLRSTAKTFVDGLTRDSVDDLTPAEIFQAMALQFLTPGAMAVAETKAEDLKRKDGESAIDFGARWLRQWMVSKTMPQQL